MKHFGSMLLALLLAVMPALGCCSGRPAGGYNKYTYEFFGVFDTVTQIVGYAQSREEFDSYARMAQRRLQELHQLYDIYNNYPGINNLKTVNDQAGVSEVEVPGEILDLLVFAKEWSGKTQGVVNIALGPVLRIWHDYREAGLSDPEKAQLPPQEELKRAKAGTDLDKVIINREKGTAFLAEKGMFLDVGAVAKGYAAEIAARELQQAGFVSGIIDCGGNIRLIGQPLDGRRKKWGIAVKNPGGNPLLPDELPLDIIFVRDAAVVTSGDYQRYYEVQGRRYHHLIDPATIMPADYYRAVTVLAADSGEADLLSSALFLLPYGDSRSLAESLPGVEALWVFGDGRIEATEGMRKVSKNMGGARPD